MKPSEHDEKGFIDTFLERIREVLNLRRFKPLIDSILTEQYVTAIQELDNQLDVGINLVPKERDLNFLKDYVNENIQTAGDTIANNLRQEIQRGILNGDDTTALASRVRALFKEKAYQTRLKTILRTETLRANNQGTLTGAKQAEDAGLKLLKWLDVVEDARTSNICMAEHRKYGTKQQAIPINEEFMVKVDNKTIKAQYPPFHPNCRTVLRIIEVDK